MAGRTSKMGLGPRTPGQKVAAAKSPAFAAALKSGRKRGFTSVGDYLGSRTPARGMAPKARTPKAPRPPRAGKPPVSTMPVGPKPKKAPRTTSR